MIQRCNWVNKDTIYIQYHDKEWGQPVHDDKLLFEMLVLEMFQAGLLWITILKKRENFRDAFDMFNYHKISEYNENKVNLLLSDKGIIRNKRKILAVIENSKIFINIQKEHTTFNNYIWGFTDFKQLKENYDNITPLKLKLAKDVSNDLIKRGMKFVGKTIIYSYLEAIGVMSNHSKECFMSNISFNLKS